MTALAADCRDDFPTLKQWVHGRPLVYLDSAATSQKPQPVITAVERFYRHDNANVHRGIHELSNRATIAYEGARERVATFLGARDPAELIWTRGTTDAINLVASGWAMGNLSPGDEILLSVMEHHSNLVPWQMAAQRTGARLRFIGLDDQQRLDLDSLDSLLTPRVRLVAARSIRCGRSRLARTPWAPRCWSTERSPRRTSGSTSRSWAATSSPSRATRCADRPGSEGCGDGGSSSSGCTRSRAEAT